MIMITHERLIDFSTRSVPVKKRDRCDGLLDYMSTFQVSASGFDSAWLVENQPKHLTCFEYGRHSMQLPKRNQ